MREIKIHRLLMLGCILTAGPQLNIMRGEVVRGPSIVSSREYSSGMLLPLDVGLPGRRQPGGSR